MHVSSRTDGAQLGGQCLPIMNFRASGKIIINSWTGSTLSLLDAIVALNM